MINGIGKSKITSASNRGGGTRIRMPNVPKMLTKGQCKLSEKELAEKIVKLAKADAAAGKDSRHGESVKGFSARVGTAEWRKLRDDFISLASPDRMGMVKNSLSGLAGKANSMQLKGNGSCDFFKILFDYSKRFGSDVGANFVNFRDENGELIARYTEPNGWSTWPTRAESARNAAFDQLWDQALADAQYEMEQEKEGSFLA